jgi:hypothetical protein
MNLKAFTLEALLSVFQDQFRPMREKGDFRQPDEPLFGGHRKEFCVPVKVFGAQFLE